MGAINRFVSIIFLDKMPPLSPGAKHTTARMLPWIFMIFGTLGLFAVISSIFTITFTNMLAMGLGQIMGMSIPALGFVMIYLLTPITQLLSIAGGYCMLRREYRGWQLSALSTFLSLFSHILYLSAVGIILDILFLYLIYQTKNRYIA